jgi:hypothetical protein
VGLSSSAARTRPRCLNDDTTSSPVFTKVNNQPRSIMKQHSSSGGANSDWPLADCSLPTVNTTPKLRGEIKEDGGKDEEQLLPGRLKRRRISWHLPGQKEEEEITGTGSDAVTDPQGEELLSESLLHRLQAGGRTQRCNISYSLRVADPVLFYFRDPNRG